MPAYSRKERMPMSYFALWVLGALLFAGALITLFNAVSRMKKIIPFQKQMLKTQKDARLKTYGALWIFIDVFLAFLLFSFGTIAPADSELASGASRLCFMSIGIFFAGKTIANWAQGRTITYAQGVVLGDQNILYTAITGIEARSVQGRILTKKEDIAVFVSQAKAIEKAREAWKQTRRKAGEKKSARAK